MDLGVRLPENIVFEILNKLEVVPLVRMRQICKQMDSVAEKNRKKLASRPRLGIDVKIEDYFDTFTANIFIVIRRNRGSYLLAMYEKQLSAIALGTIKVAIKFGREYELLVNELFNRLQPTCKILHISNFSLDLVLPLADSVTNIDALELALPDKLEADTITAINQLQQRSKFRLHCIGEQNDEIFEKVKHFEQVDIVTNMNGYFCLLYDIQHSTEEITLKSIQITLDSILDADDDDSDLIILPFQYALICPSDDKADNVSVISIFFMEKSAVEVEKKVMYFYGYGEDMKDEVHSWVLGWLENSE